MAKKAPKTKNKPQKVYKGTGIYWGFLAVLLTIVALVILAAQNTNPVEFRFLSWTFRYPLVAILLATIGFSVLLDELVGFFWRSRRRRILAMKAELRELREKAARAEEALMAPAETDAVTEGRTGSGAVPDPQSEATGSPEPAENGAFGS